MTSPVTTHVLDTARGKPAASGQAAASRPAKTQWTQSANVKAEGPYRFDFNLD